MNAMAELHVQRKRHSLAWLWTLIIILVIGAGVYLFLHYKNPREFPVPGKSTSSVTSGKLSTIGTI
jgi:hypothetical protein